MALFKGLLDLLNRIGAKNSQTTPYTVGLNSIDNKLIGGDVPSPFGRNTPVNFTKDSYVVGLSTIENNLISNGGPTLNPDGRNTTVATTSKPYTVGSNEINNK